MGGCPGFTDQNGKSESFTDQNGKIYGTFLLLYGRDKRSKTGFPIGYKVWAASLQGLVSALTLCRFCVKYFTWSSNVRVNSKVSELVVVYKPNLTQPNRRIPLKKAHLFQIGDTQGGFLIRKIRSKFEGIPNRNWTALNTWPPQAEIFENVRC